MKDIVRTGSQFAKNSLSYDLSRLMNRNLMRSPLATYIRLTRECNMRCKYCYLGPEDRNDVIDEKVLMRIIEESRSLGVRFFGFSGGEPLLKSNLIISVLSKVRDDNVKGIVYTNGTMNSRAECLELIENGVIGWCISIDGTEPVHDGQRSRGSYRKAVRMLKMLKEIREKEKKGITVHIDATLTKNNLHDVDHLIYLSRKYGTILWSQPLFRLTDKRIRADYPHLVPKGDDLHLLEKNIHHLIELKSKESKLIGNPSSGLLEIGRYYSNFQTYERTPCLAGVRNIHIDDQGGMRPCWFWKPSGNILKEDIRTIYRSEVHWKEIREMQQCKFSCLCNSHYVPGPISGALKDMLYYPLTRRLSRGKGGPC